MANPSPGQRLRTTTSDITEFFRTGNTRSRAADPDVPGISSPELLSEPESPVKKRSSRIPFLGRSRKKSTQSDASTSASSTRASGSRQSDSDARSSSASRKVEKRSSDVPAVPPLGKPEEHPLPPLPSPSLGSILAARFAPLNPKLLNRRPSQRSPPNEHTSELLQPMGTARGPSLDSTSSDNRSPTPRPQPIITVSLPPDNLDGYEGMFTLPASTTEVTAVDPQLAPTTSNSTNTGVRFPTPPLNDSQIRLSDTDSTIKRRGSRHTTEERSSSRASRSSRKHVGSSVKPFDVDSTDAEDSEAVMSDSPRPSPPMSSGPTPTAEKRRTLATMPYNFAEKATSQPRSIMKSTSDRRTRPPAFPLPPPPASNPPSSALPLTPSHTHPPSKSSSGPSASLISRPRAQTLSFLPISPTSSSSPASATLPLSSSPSPASPSTIPSRRVTRSIGEANAPITLLTKKVVEERSGKENFDMDKATPEQLRQALTLRNQQFDELASYLLKITDAHVAEKHALQKKITTLEQEATRRDNEIKGLTWLVTNNRPGSSGSASKTSAPELEHSSAKQPGAVSKLSKAASLRHSNPAEDSGTESHQTTSGAEESYRESGPESMWGSGTSDPESSTSSRARKVKRNHTLMSSFYRVSGKGDALTSLPYFSSQGTKRSSISSFGTSPSSSTSSLALTTLTPATTVTSLTAIPEAPTVSTPRSQDPVVAAAIKATENQRAKEEERRMSRTSQRSSASSVNAPAPSSASTSYSANLKRGRPPSIAQVLAQSPKMEHGRDKLRFYSTSGSASS
ncbi:hypothetical protein C8J57DRAFT_1458096 [Mycena rebaudengoi]|nr:hypothetical protein C8J57DRAFT_1458096 [Mycena rebaudengoi]